MNRTFSKLIVGGILFGAFLFFLPFLLFKVFFFFLILGTISWFFRGRRKNYAQYRWAMADRIRSMSDEEYQQFREARSHCRQDWSNAKKENND